MMLADTLKQKCRDKGLGTHLRKTDYLQKLTEAKLTYEELDSEDWETMRTNAKLAVPSTCSRSELLRLLLGLPGDHPHKANSVVHVQQECLHPGSSEAAEPHPMQTRVTVGHLNLLLIKSLKQKCRDKGLGTNLRKNDYLQRLAEAKLTYEELDSEDWEAMRTNAELAVPSTCSRSEVLCLLLDLSGSHPHKADAVVHVQQESLPLGSSKAAEPGQMQAPVMVEHLNSLEELESPPLKAQQPVDADCPLPRTQQTGFMGNETYKKLLRRAGLVLEHDQHVYHIIHRSLGGADHVDNYDFVRSRSVNLHINDRQVEFNCYMAGVSKTTKALKVSMESGNIEKGVRRKYKPVHSYVAETEARYLFAIGEKNFKNMTRNWIQK